MIYRFRFCPTVSSPCSSPGFVLDSTAPLRTSSLSVACLTADPLVALMAEASEIIFFDLGFLGVLVWTVRGRFQAYENNRQLTCL